MHGEERRDGRGPPHLVRLRASGRIRLGLRAGVKIKVRDRVRVRARARIRDRVRIRAREVEGAIVAAEEVTDGGGSRGNHLHEAEG